MLAAAGTGKPAARRWRTLARCGLAALLWLALLPGARATEPGPKDITLRLYFSNEGLNPTPWDCSVVFPVERQLRQLPAMTRSAMARAALQQLLAGPSATERAAGYHSMFSAASAGLLRRLRIDGAIAYVDLADFRARLPGSSSSCGAAEFHAQIERTLRQLGGIRRVRYAIDGDPRSFHDWMGEPCGKADGCNPQPFRVQGGQ